MTTPTSPTDLPDRTWHILRGARYEGTITIETATPLEDSDWIEIRFDGRYTWNVRLQDCFPNEHEARTEAKARRPRTTRQPRPLYGDYAQLAALHGIATDGTGRRTR